MSKFIATFCLILAIAGTFYPCCMEDNCADEPVMAGTHKPDEHREDKGPCSPFFACGSCAASIEIATLSYTICRPTLLITHYQSYIVLAGGDYSSTLFQPPRLLIS